MRDASEVVAGLVFIALLMGACLVALDRDSTRKAEIVKLQIERGCK